jgi:hypothetical protein
VKTLVFAALVLAAPPSRSDWIALANGGFAVPAGRDAVGMLVEMNTLLASEDPILRDVWRSAPQSGGSLLSFIPSRTRPIP